MTSNDSKLCDSVTRCCNSESETEEKDKTLHMLDSEAKTEDQFVGRQKQLATIEKHRLVREKADMNYMKTALKMQDRCTQFVSLELESMSVFGYHGMNEAARYQLL